MRSDSGKELLYIIKAGGNVIDNAGSLNKFLLDFSSIKEKKILVHGGGKIATAIGDKLGIQSKYIDGRRITDSETIDLVTMVYGGLVNKKIVATLQSMQCNAIGLSGADANTLPAKKRPVKVLSSGEGLSKGLLRRGEVIDYGWVGDVDSNEVNPATWQLFLDNNITPVVSSLTHDREGHILNTNADTIASVLAVTLAKLFEVKLIFCFEKNGVLLDVNDEGSALPQINKKSYVELKENKKLFAGILPKIDNALDAVDRGVTCVVIGNSNHLLQMINEESGTKIIS
ncbi:MAG: acetylglutamate kinase [Bacteroidota bacterium]|nr:acetylglutamate kinase [Bacteroidota bacterium]